MEASSPVQGVTLKQFLLDLATNPQLQLRLAALYKDTFHRFLTEQGLSDEDAQLLSNAHASDEGKMKLARKLTTMPDCWSCSSNYALTDE